MSLEEQLVDAVEGNNIEKVRSLLEKGANSNIGVIDPIVGNKTIMCIAAEEGNIEIMKLLLKHGADIDKGEKGTKGQNFTPLNAAIILGQEEAAIFLIKNGANIHYEDHDKSTPLHNAVYGRFRKLVALLLNMGANVRTKNLDKNTPLHIATSHYADPQIIRLLLEYGSSVNNTGYSGYTPLRNYMKNYDLYSTITSKRPLESFFLLLLFGADVNKECKDTRKRINYTSCLKNCLSAFEEIKAMPCLDKLIEANIKRDKKENVRVIASYINNKAEGQELIKEFSAITKSSDKQLSFVPEHLFSLIKKIGLEYKISKEFGKKVISGFLAMQGATGADDISAVIASDLSKNDIMNVAFSNEQSYKALKPLNKLMTELKDICKMPNTALAASQSEAVPSQSRHCIS